MHFKDDISNPAELIQQISQKMSLWLTQSLMYIAFKPSDNLQREDTNSPLTMATFTRPVPRWPTGSDVSAWA